jgi:flagella basal body P-ring formation protein FlgA
MRPRPILLPACLACLAAFAVSAEGPQPLEQIRAAAQDYVAARLGGAQASAGTLDPRLRLPACGQPLQAGGPAPNPGNAWTVAVHCPGPAVWTLYVPVRASQRRPVVVLTRALGPGVPVPADALALQERDVGALTYGYMAQPEDVAGKLLRRPLAAGAAVTPDALANPASIRRGQQVTLLSRSGSFEVRADGKALADGASGERIRAENLDSHRIVEGVVRDGGTVEVGL